MKNQKLNNYKKAGSYINIMSEIKRKSNLSKFTSKISNKNKNSSSVNRK